MKVRNRNIAYQYFILVIGLTTFFHSCKLLKNNNVTANEKLLQLISPIKLETELTEIFLEDYILNADQIESISFSSDIKYKYNETTKAITVQSKPNYPPIFVLSVQTKTETYDIPIFKNEKLKYTFIFDPKGQNFEEVKMKGEMNAWNQNAQDFELVDGKYEMSFYVKPGTYQYKMVINGKEFCDFNNPDSISNGIGGYNSLLNAFVNNEPAFKIKTSNVNFEKNSNFYTLETGKTIPDEFIFFKNNELAGIEKVNPSTFKKTKQGNYFIELKIPSELNVLKKSYLRVYALKGNQKSNDIKIPLEYGKIITETEKLSRLDFEKTTLYNVFVDRFYDGEKSNNKPITDGSVLPKANNMGGDIQGAVQKIKDGYFKEIGVNSIWISPIVKNDDGAWGYWKNPETKFSSYHGYWPISFTQVEPKLTTEQALHELVQVAHQNNMNVFLDFVANHVHQNHPFYQANKHLATNLYLPDGSLNTERWDDHRLTTWFDTFMPTLDLEQPECYQMLADSAVYWIKKYNFDGFRHDATKHVPQVFWRTLTRKLKQQVIIPENRPLYQIGETYGTRELVGSYVNSGQLDAQFDFNVYDAMVSALAGDSDFIGLNNSIQASLDAFGSHHLMGNITGNQDRARFASYAGGDLLFSQDAKHEGWTRKVTMGDEIAYQKTKQLFALIASVPGIPVVFYGDEIAMVGGGDPDNRKMMRFDDLNEKETDCKNTLKQLLNLRQKSMPFLYGNFETHITEENIYAFSRNYCNQSELVLINNSNEDKALNVPLNDTQILLNETTNFGGRVIKRNNNQLQINMPANSFEVISFK